MVASSSSSTRLIFLWLRTTAATTSWEGCLHWRRRQPSRLPGSVREVDCCWACHLGCWMCKRCSWSLRQDVTLHPVEK